MPPSDRIEPARDAPPDPVSPGGIHEPVLPPRVTLELDDTWKGVEREPNTQFHHVDVVPRRPGVWLLPTRAARVIVVIGCMGAVFATLVLLVALMPAFETGESRGFVIPLDENALFSASLIVSSIVIYLGWFWWTVSAAFNAERIVPLATSPWLPMFVYVGGPLISLVGADLGNELAPVIVWCGLVWLGTGHILVVASFRATAGRIGASREDFSKLIWLPLAWVSYRMGLETLLSFFDDESRLPGFLVLVGCLGVLFPVALVVATWNAMASFERACRRLNLRTLGDDVSVRELLRARSGRG